MDVQMPVLDGHDATRLIRLELRLADLPIIALTAGALSSERQRATAAGMDDYIVKPFDAKGLVASILRRVKQTDESWCGGPCQRRLRRSRHACLRQCRGWRSKALIRATRVSAWEGTSTCSGPCWNICSRSSLTC